MNEIFQQFGKQDQFKYIKKRLVNIDKSLTLQLFNKTFGILLEPGVLLE